MGRMLLMIVIPAPFSDQPTKAQNPMMNISTPPLQGRITQFLFLTTFIIILVYTGFSSVQAGPITATDKTPKPADPFFNSQRITFDCTALDTLELSPGLVDTLRGDTTDGPTNLPGYNCALWAEEGPEHIYRLDITTELELWAGLRDMGDIDFDIFLLSDCDTDSCLVGQNTEFSIFLDPGTYYLIIDGAGSDASNAGPYTVALETRWIGLPSAICEPGFATPVACGVTETAIEDNLFEELNHVQTYECSPITERGGEDWFAITLEPHHEFTATTTYLPPLLDAALWIFDDCGNNAVCLAFADAGVAGEHESLGWANDSDEPLTIYFALDSYRLPTSEAAGFYGIQFVCQSNVATDNTSWGSIRSNFR